MKNIKAQLQFVKMLAEDLLNNSEENLKNREKAQNRYYEQKLRRYRIKAQDNIFAAGINEPQKHAGKRVKGE